MSIEIIATIIASAVAVIGVYVNWRKWRQEKRKNELDMDKLEDQKLIEIIHSEMGKDTIAIKGAQEAVTLMERMLAVAAQSEAKLQERVAQQAVRITHLEDENELLKTKLREQESKLREQERVNKDLTCRLEALENKE